MRWTLPLVLWTTLLGACEQQAEPLTELVVVVDSDLSVPGMLDEIQIRATDPAGDVQQASAQLGDGEMALPRSLVLRHSGGALGEFAVRVQGRRAGDVVLEREAQVTFLRGQSLLLPMHLVSACREQRCDVGESCGESGCESVVIAADQLSPWDGEKPRLDAGAAPAEEAGTSGDAGAEDAASAEAGQDASDAEAGVDAGMCTPEPEQCNQRDDDCNGRIDDGFDLMTDPENCGRCGMRCNTARRDVCCRGTCARNCQ